jgi:5-methylcytosine-specific restriction endonuclease McrA
MSEAFEAWLSRQYRGSAWRAVSLRIRERDNFECQIKGPNCLGVAGTTDHIISPRLGGAFYDPTNLRAACKKCNSSRGAKWNNAQRAAAYRREQQGQSQTGGRRPSREW